MRLSTCSCCCGGRLEKCCSLFCNRACCCGGSLRNCESFSSARRCCAGGNSFPAQHALVLSPVSANFQLASHKWNFFARRDGACSVSTARDAASRVPTVDSGSRIRGYVVLHL